jgi:hypothetical protein
MKIKPEHYAHLKRALAGRLTPTATMRERWDALWAAGLGPYLSKEIYPYANDDHIDTALRTIARDRSHNPRRLKKLPRRSRRAVRRTDRLVGHSQNPRRKRRRNPRGLYRLSWTTFHTGPQYKDGTLQELKPAIRHLISQHTPYRLVDASGREIRKAHHGALTKIRPRRRNPRSPLFKLLAQRAGGKRLVYLGGVKFAERGRPVYFKTPEGARTVAKLLRLQFPMLRRYAFGVAGA